MVRFGWWYCWRGICTMYVLLTLTMFSSDEGFSILSMVIVLADRVLLIGPVIVWRIINGMASSAPDRNHQWEWWHMACWIIVMRVMWWRPQGLVSIRTVSLQEIRQIKSLPRNRRKGIKMHVLLKPSRCACIGGLKAVESVNMSVNQGDILESLDRMAGKTTFF